MQSDLYLIWAFGLVSGRCASGGLVLAGFRVGSTGFSWFRLVSGRFGFLVITLAMPRASCVPFYFLS